MKLKLEKDLVVFDVETTGLSIVCDRVVQLAILKIFADGRPSVERCRLINPTIPIPKEVSDIHGITDEMVKVQPTFRELAPGLIALIGDADFLTFNGNRYDIPLIMEEFNRAGKTFDMTNRKTLDVQRIFHKMEPRTLSAAVKFYTNEKHESAHDALGDVKATLNVFLAQLERYKDSDYEEKDGSVLSKPIKNDMQAIHNFVNDPNEVDFQGKIKIKGGEAVFTFGKYQDKPVGKNLAGDPKYMSWIINGDFSFDTKNHIIRLVKEFQEQNAGTVRI